MSDLILILDDELSYAMMVSDLLTEYGYRTDVCTDPREALERLHQQSYGLIISDYKMPGVDGAQLLAEVRKVLPNIPVIMISGLMGKPELLRVANIGVTLVLEKPFNVPEFLEQVARFVQSAEDAGVDEFSVAVPEATSAEAALDYPRPASRVVDESPLMQVFLDQFWRNLQRYAHLPLVIPAGGEFEALVRQANDWIEETPADPLRIAFPALGRAETRAALASRAAEMEGSLVVAVTVPGQAEVDLKTLEDLIRWTLQEPAVGAHLRFIYALPDVIEARKLVLAEDLLEAVAKPQALSPLRERLSDLGAWIERTLAELGTDRARPLSAGAVEVLLQAEWAGNHQELVGTLRRAVALSRRGEVTEAAVRLAMRGRHVDPPEEDETCDLASFLRAEQLRFLEQHLPKKDQFEALSRMVGGQLDRLRADRDIKEQPLLFAELTELSPAHPGAPAPAAR